MDSDPTLDKILETQLHAVLLDHPDAVFSAEVINQLVPAKRAGRPEEVADLAGFLASLVASVVGWALARFAFEFEWTVSPWVPLAGALAGAALALGAGWWGLRDVLNRPVMDTLRRAAE